LLPNKLAQVAELKPGNTAAQKDLTGSLTAVRILQSATGAQGVLAVRDVHAMLGRAHAQTQCTPDDVRHTAYASLLCKSLMARKACLLCKAGTGPRGQHALWSHAALRAKKPNASRQARTAMEVHIPSKPNDRLASSRVCSLQRPTCKLDWRLAPPQFREIV
jgi:hypothetical protein